MTLLLSSGSLRLPHTWERMPTLHGERKSMCSLGWEALLSGTLWPVASCCSKGPCMIGWPHLSLYWPHSPLKFSPASRKGPSSWLQLGEPQEKGTDWLQQSQEPVKRGCIFGPAQTTFPPLTNHCSQKSGVTSEDSSPHFWLAGLEEG